MNSAVIVAGGKGVRMGERTDKLFLTLLGRPVLAHAWARLDRSCAIDEVVVVVRRDIEEAVHELGRSGMFQKPFRIVHGGKERQDSVWNGLQAVSMEATVVAIHDGARPCVPLELIADTVQQARIHGAAVAAQRVTDTIKESEDGEFVARNVERSRLWAVQTPQAFRKEVIQKALQAVRAAGILVTDDTAACELIGQPVRLVESKQPNPKVTFPSDLKYIEHLLSESGD